METKFIPRDLVAYENAQPDVLVCFFTKESQGPIMIQSCVQTPKYIDDLLRCRTKADAIEKIKGLSIHNLKGVGFCIDWEQPGKEQRFKTLNEFLPALEALSSKVDKKVKVDRKVAKPAARPVAPPIASSVAPSVALLITSSSIALLVGEPVAASVAPPIAEPVTSCMYR